MSLVEHVLTISPPLLLEVLPFVFSLSRLAVQTHREGTDSHLNYRNINVRNTVHVFIAYTSDTNT